MSQPGGNTDCICTPALLGDKSVCYNLSAGLLGGGTGEIDDFLPTKPGETIGDCFIEDPNGPAMKPGKGDQVKNKKSGDRSVHTQNCRCTHT